MTDGKLKLGKGAAFVKSRLKALRRKDDTWEADFRALPKPMTQSETHYLGLVVTQPDGLLLADLPVEYTPDANDLATLLAHAMRRPLTDGAHRPRRIQVRKNPRWAELFPHLKEIGVEAVARSELLKVNEAFEEYLRRSREARSAGAVKPSADQEAVEKLFPAVAKWVKGYGYVEVGDQEGFGFVVRAVDYGGVVFEDDKPTTLADLDLKTGTVLFREKKKSRTAETLRRGKLTPALVTALGGWLAGKHPGGPLVFCRRAGETLTDHAVKNLFRRAVAESKWSVLRGYHVLRHSFASNLAAAGTDQRVIDGLMGHTTEEMRKRYRHLYPEQKDAAVLGVYG